jgi:cobalt-zinc-cadmium efflux system protein
MAHHEIATHHEDRAIFTGAPSRTRRPMVLALGITVAFGAVEIAGALLTGSLALLADAGHMLSDMGALLMALSAMWLAQRPHTTTRSYGYLRAEVLAALLNGLALWAIAGYIFWEAAHRFVDVPEVRSAPMLVVAVLGLGANLIAAFLLSKDSKESINIRGAFLHVMGDLLGSAGAILAGILMLTMGWYIADPIISVFIGLIIVAGSFRLVREATNVLLEGVPAHVDMVELQRAIEVFNGIQSVHDLHTWTLTSGYDAMSTHVVVQSDCSAEDSQHVLEGLRSMIGQRFGIAHVTIQVERGEGDCEESHMPEHQT